MNDFYRDLLSNINDLINQKQYQKALNLIDEELNMPFVPQQIEDRLVSFKAEILPHLENETKQQFLSNQQLYQYLTSTDAKCYKALQFLKQANVRNYLPIVEDILADSSVNHLIKSLLFEILIDQRVDKTIVFVSHNKSHKINPISTDKVLQQESFNLVNKKLEAFVKNNPSFLNQCQLVLVNALYDLYPDLLSESEVDIYCLSIIRYVFKAYGDIEQWQQFSQYFSVDESCLIDFAF